MKHIMPFFVACALLVGSACSTYTSTTDPNDTGSGTALQTEGSTSEAEAPSTHTTTQAAPAAEAAH